MAITWGEWTTLTASNQQFRVGYETTLSNANVTVTFYGECAAPIADSVNLNRTSPSAIAGTYRYAWNSNGGQVTIGSWAFNGTRGSSYNIGADISDIYNGQTPDVSGTLTIPYAAPAAPTGVSVSRVSDTTQKLRWTPQPSASAPYVAVQVQRQTDVSAAAWTVVTNHVAGDATSYDDTTTGADAAYRYRIRSANFSGESVWVTTDWIYTTPAPPKGFALTRSGSTIVASWQQGSRWADTYEVQYRENGGAWTAWAKTTALQVSRTAAATSTWEARVRVIAGGMASAWVTSGSAFAAPAPPSLCTAARVSDTQQLVTITPGAANGDPTVRHEFFVQEGTESASWVSLGKQAGAVFTHSGTKAASRYRYRARSEGSGGVSGYSPISAWLYTTPAAPSSLKVTKSGATVNLSWAHTPAYRNGFYVEDNPGGVGFTRIATTENLTLSRTNVATDVTHRYRVQAFVLDVPLAAGGTVALLSGYVTGATISLVSPPAAPTITLSPDMLMDITRSALTVHVQHNPTDATAATAAQLRYRLNGSTAWTTKTVPVATMSVLLTTAELTNGATYELQACTKGDATEYGPWSASTLARTAATPVGTFTQPAGDLQTSTLRVAVAVTTTTGTMTAWRFELWKTDDVPTLYYSRQNTSASQLTVPVPLLEGTYELRGWAKDSGLLWSDPFTRQFTVSYAKPPAPVCDSSWDDDGAMTLVVSTPPPAAGQTAVASIQVWRGDALAGEIPGTSGVIRDPIAPLEGVTYRAVSVSAIPSTAETVHESEPYSGPCWIFLNAGPDFAHVAKLMIDPAISISPRGVRVLQDFDGRPAAVEFTSAAQPAQLRLSGKVRDHGPIEERRSSWRAWDALRQMTAPICYRDPLGRRLFVSVSVDDVGHDTSMHVGVSATLTEVDYEE